MQNIFSFTCNQYKKSSVTCSTFFFHTLQEIQCVFYTHSTSQPRVRRSHVPTCGHCSGQHGSRPLATSSRSCSELVTQHARLCLVSPWGLLRAWAQHALWSWSRLACPRVTRLLRSLFPACLVPTLSLQGALSTPLTSTQTTPLPANLCSPSGLDGGTEVGG